VAEWSNAAVSKTVIGATLSRVRIPPSPQLFVETLFLTHLILFKSSKTFTLFYEIITPGNGIKEETMLKTL
jgi:hypothetical protein